MAQIRVRLASIRFSVMLKYFYFHKNPNKKKRFNAFLPPTSNHQALTQKLQAKSITHLALNQEFLALNKTFLVKGKNVQAKSQEFLAFNQALQALSFDDEAFNQETAIKIKNPGVIPGFVE